jgi:hypothetical protein
MKGGAMESIPFDALDRIALELGALVVLCALQCILLLFVAAMVGRRRAAKS